jgi:ABC-type amino acid transport substrate-binding protein
MNAYAARQFLARLVAIAVLACLLPVSALAQSDSARLEGRLKKIQKTRVIVLAYRTDAFPFSFADVDGRPAGYMVDLCRAVVGGIERQLGAGPLRVDWVPVSVQSRFAAIRSGKADLECGATSLTLGRMKEVDFSTLTFVDGTGLLVRTSTSANSLLDLAGKRIGVIRGTSNERALADAMRSRIVNAHVVQVETRTEGLEQLEAGTIDAFAGDRTLLIGIAIKAKDRGSLVLIGDMLSYEPYAIVLPRGDWAMRHAVNSALARIYKSSAVMEIYNRWLGGLGKPNHTLEVMYELGRLPE